MKIALVHKHFDEKHLEEVKSEMLTLGAPVIRAVWMECYGHYAAIEGCHRIRAAKELGLVPEIKEIEYIDEIADGSNCTISEICDMSHKSAIIDF